MAVLTPEWHFCYPQQQEFSVSAYAILSIVMLYEIPVSLCESSLRDQTSIFKFCSLITLLFKIYLYNLLLQLALMPCWPLLLLAHYVSPQHNGL